VVNPAFLLDSNVLSEPLRPRPSGRLLGLLDSNHDRLATCTTVWHELHYGLERLARSRRREAIEAYLTELASSSLVIMPYGVEAARWHAAERARLERMGRSVSFADGQIAAVARVHGLVLVTANARDFELFEGLAVESWL
jgi:tRNA(fMet)-specific endonuclease VapC